MNHLRALKDLQHRFKFESFFSVEKIQKKQKKDLLSFFFVSATKKKEREKEKRKSMVGTVSATPAYEMSKKKFMLLSVFFKTEISVLSTKRRLPSKRHILKCYSC